MPNASIHGPEALLITKENGSKTKDLVKVSASIKMAQFTKALLKTTKDTEMVLARLMKTSATTSALGKRMSNMVRGLSRGRIELNSLVTGLMVRVRQALLLILLVTPRISLDIRLAFN
jgi:hypothetical protein